MGLYGFAKIIFVSFVSHVTTHVLLSHLNIMAELANIQYNGIPIIMYVMIGITTAVLSYTTLMSDAKDEEVDDGSLPTESSPSVPQTESSPSIPIEEREQSPPDIQSTQLGGRRKKHRRTKHNTKQNGTTKRK
jgi:hypothetical protein